MEITIKIDTMCCFLFCIIMFMLMCCVYNEYNSPLLKNYKHASFTEMLGATDLNNISHCNYLTLQIAVIFLCLVCYAICKNTIRANCDSCCFNCVITSLLFCCCFQNSDTKSNSTVPDVACNFSLIHQNHAHLFWHRLFGLIVATNIALQLSESPESRCKKCL